MYFGIGVGLLLSFAGDESEMINVKLTAEFCRSPGSNSDEEEIVLGDIEKVKQGTIHMPTSYGNRSDPGQCIVTIRGIGDSVIIFSHKRQNAANGPCLRQTVIDDAIHEGPCSEQRVPFRGITEIILRENRLVQPAFIIHFTGMFESYHWSHLPFYDHHRPLIVSSHIFRLADSSTYNSTVVSFLHMDRQLIIVVMNKNQQCMDTCSLLRVCSTIGSHELI